MAEWLTSGTPVRCEVGRDGSSTTSMWLPASSPGWRVGLRCDLYLARALATGARGSRRHPSSVGEPAGPHTDAGAGAPTRSMPSQRPTPSAGSYRT